jgi:NitT/TauT family transport system substrate-binding protein
MRTMKTTGKGIHVALLLIALVFGPSAGEPAVAAERVKVATPGVTDFGMLPVILAKEKGFYEREGIDAELIHFKGGGELTAAFASGDVLIGSTAVTTNSRGTAMGFPTTIIAELTRYPKNWGLMVLPNSPIKSVKELKPGAKIAITRAGSQTHFVGLLMVAEAGLKPEDVNFAPLGDPTAMVAAMKAGQVDAMIGYSPLSVSLVLKGEAKMLADISDVVPKFSNYVMAANPKFVAERPETVKKVLKAVFLATAWMKGHPKETQEIMARMYKIDAELARKLYETEIDNFTDDGRVDPKAVEFLIEASLKYKFYDKRPALSQVLDTRFLPVR